MTMAVTVVQRFGDVPGVHRPDLRSDPVLSQRCAPDTMRVRYTVDGRQFLVLRGAMRDLLLYRRPDARAFAAAIIAPLIESAQT
jgi:hypothetical protein